MNIKDIILLEDVIDDLKLGKKFYEEQNKGLGDYFKDCIISDIESLWLYAGIHVKFENVYRLLSKTFPYAIYYEIKKTL